MMMMIRILMVTRRNRSMTMTMFTLLAVQELGYLTKLKEEFESRQVKIVTISPDTSTCLELIRS
jgi:hypothetical protein